MMAVCHGRRKKHPQQILIVPQERVVRCASSAGNTVLVTVSGKLFLSSQNEDSGALKGIDLPGAHVQDATIYRGEIIFVADTGEVFCCKLDGSDIRVVNIEEPRKTCSHGQEERGRRVRISQVASGQDHILYLSNKNEIWVQGCGPALGLFTNKVENEITNPVRLDFFQGRKVLQVDAGGFFSVALVEEIKEDTSEKDSDFKGETDLDSYVRTCDHCRVETGDRVLFDDTDDAVKCPLGLGITKGCNTPDRKSDILSPALSSVNLDGRSSQNSVAPEELDATDGFPCSGVYPKDDNEKRTKDDDFYKRKHKVSDCSDFEVVDCNEQDRKDLENVDSDSVSGSSIFINTDAARQFISKQLSWMTSKSEGEGEDEVYRSVGYRYPIDSATVLIKENVASAASSAASLVATGVKTVSDKVGQLSRHFSSSEGGILEGEDISPDADPFSMEDMPRRIALDTSMIRSESCDTRSLPRTLSGDLRNEKSHTRTASGGFARMEGNSLVERGPKQVEETATQMMEGGRAVINSEVWTWGSGNKGQLGLGDNNHRTSPCNVIPLNHQGIIKVVCGSHHAAALTIDGQIYSWGDNASGQLGVGSIGFSSSPKVLIIMDAVQDIAAGNDYTLAVSLKGKLLCTDQIKEGKTSDLEEMGDIDENLYVCSVLCSDDSLIYTVDSCVDEVKSFQQEEALYLTVLKMAGENLINPLMTSLNTPGNAKNGTTSFHDKNEIVECKRALFEAYMNLLWVVAYMIKSMTGRVPIIDLPVISNVEELKTVYGNYISKVCDVLAVTGFILVGKDATATMEKFRLLLLNLVPSISSKTNNETLSFVLLQPLERIHQYEKFLSVLQSSEKMFHSPFTQNRIFIASAYWRQLSNRANKEKMEAEVTRSYWESSSSRFYEALALPSRRVLRDSRVHAITVYNAGRFSSHSFLLLSDTLVHCHYTTYTLYPLSTMWVETVPNTSTLQNAIQLTTPEDTITLVCQVSQEKSLWSYSLQEAIKKNIPGVSEMMRSPPLVRTAEYTFTKHPQYKDATYKGQWFCGKLHGEGTLEWKDGRRYEGQFRQSIFHGPGRKEVPGSDGVTIYEGTWVSGKLEGRGVIKYGNKDIYSGFLKDGQPHGHGELKKGQFSSQAASVYTGEWSNGSRHGYGVLDDIAQGEKFLGMWQNNQRQGPGMVVTMNGVYYEGTFSQNKLSGFGLMMFEDGTHYEGELGSGGTFSGKGVLKYPGGDVLEGTFTGSWAVGVKVNAMLHRAGPMQEEVTQPPSSFGKLSVSVSQKWVAIFRHCEEQLSISSMENKETSKVWEALAAHLNTEKLALQRLGGSLEALDGLDRIPDQKDDLTWDGFQDLQSYLNKAFDSRLHPLGHLLKSLVDAFRATYGGVVAHPCLLQYAVDEVRSFTSRLYSLVCILFPSLPGEGSNILLQSPDEEEVVVTAATVVHPWLLPHVYSPLSTLYVLQHQKEDTEYWNRLLKWNRQSDIALMTFLGVDVKFWLPEGGSIVESSHALGSIKDHHFTDAVDTLQLLSTSFTPQDKLALIHSTFQQVNKSVANKLGTNFLWCMDDLFPVFQYVVVRSRIQHLGAEIELIEDLLDPHLQLGELGIMFTTLKACYYQIQNEKMNVAS
ncbi:alsin-like isoform X2 [Oratosquilla oratoria]|uniref:alsin-like isoform X2 n=1 Tax=Oratosquilla oratoria TaxID=337810 RepID=UPI003F76FB7E